MPRNIALVIIALCVAFTVQFWWIAWISDDAMITLRQVQMFTKGHGIVWNDGVRVQAFTHPLWFFILSAGYFVSGSLFLSTLVISYIFVGAALGLFWYYCYNNINRVVLAIAAMTLPLLSTPFRDFSSSGLENPLSLLLIALIFTIMPSVLKGKHRLWIWALLAAAVLTRQDHAIHFLPLAIWLIWRDFSKETLRAVLLPGLVFFAWFAFATFYFGYPLPNTYLAKINTWIPLVQKIENGIAFYQYTFETNIYLLMTIFIGLVTGLLLKGTSRLLAVGLLGHLVYIVWVGGDFMQGRFFVNDFFIALFLLINFANKNRRFSLVFLALPILGIISDKAYIVETNLHNLEWGTTIDERLFYINYSHMSPNRNWPDPEMIFPDVQENTDVFIHCGLIGGIRFRVDSSVYIVDPCGLTDPFLSRMPVYKGREYRPGHYDRSIPINYAQLVTGAETIPEQASSAELWNDLWLVTRAPLFSKDRISALRRVLQNKYAIDYGFWYSDAPDAEHPEYSPQQFWLSGEREIPPIYPWDID